MERTEFWTDGGTLWMPPQSSTTAHEIDALFYFILYTGTALTLLVAVMAVYFAWKYRRRTQRDRLTPVKESKALELSWIVIPTILVLVVFFWGFRAYVSTSIPPPNAYEINVKGQQFFWTFEYPNGLVTQNELVVPAGQPVKLIMTSQDVLHSFWVPEFRIKHDVIPNRFSFVWFNAPEPGVYQVLCTEYCGTNHSNMGAKIRVVGRGEFAEFLRTGGGGDEDLSLVQLGEQLYTARNCNACHSLDGSSGVGPTWQGLWMANRQFTDGTSGVADEEYLVESILYPAAKIVAGYQNQMPSYQGLLTDRQVAALNAYIREINGAATEADHALPGDAPADAADGDATPGAGPGAPNPAN
ncbi:MAG: cytochrome c oxidase subunit II [Rubricoccaceae bacterium]